MKLAVEEAESALLRVAIPRWGHLVSSAVSRTEVHRALTLADAEAVSRGLTVLRGIELIRVSDEVLAAAGALLPPEIRSLAAIHLATAAVLGEDLERLCTYDQRMVTAAEAAGITVVSPG